MTLKDNSKGYSIFLVSMLMYGVYSLALTAWAVIDNCGIPYMGSSILNIINAISGRVPIIVLSIMFITAGKNIERCLQALSLYFVLCIAAIVTVFVTNLIGYGAIGDFGTLITRILSICFSILAIFGIKVIKDTGKTQFFKAVWLIAIIYNIFIETTYIIATSRVLLSFSYTGYATIYLTTVVTTVLYMIFNISLYIFVRGIDTTEVPTENIDCGEANIAKCVILTIITLGVYQWIWLYSIIKNIKHMSNDEGSAVSELLCLMFVPFYWFYWVYTRAKTIKQQADKRQVAMSDNSVLYLVLSFLRFGILNIALMQNDLNTIIKYTKINA